MQAPRYCSLRGRVRSASNTRVQDRLRVAHGLPPKCDEPQTQYAWEGWIVRADAKVGKGHTLSRAAVMAAARCVTRCATTQESTQGQGGCTMRDKMREYIKTAAKAPHHTWLHISVLTAGPTRLHANATCPEKRGPAEGEGAHALVHSHTPHGGRPHASAHMHHEAQEQRPAAWLARRHCCARTDCRSDARVILQHSPSGWLPCR